MEELIEYVKNEMVEAREYFDNDEHLMKCSNKLDGMTKALDYLTVDMLKR